MRFFYVIIQDKEIKSLQRAERRRVAEMSKLQSQKERMENMLKYKSQQVAASEKKLSAMMNKRSEVRANKIKDGIKTIGQHKEVLNRELAVLVATNEAKYGIERLKKVYSIKLMPKF